MQSQIIRQTDKLKNTHIPRRVIFLGFTKKEDRKQTMTQTSDVG